MDARALDRGRCRGEPELPLEFSAKVGRKVFFGVLHATCNSGRTSAVTGDGGLIFHFKGARRRPLVHGMVTRQSIREFESSVVQYIF